MRLGRLYSRRPGSGVIAAMSRPKRIPFDSLVLAAVTAELQTLVGGRLQRAVQPSERTLVLGIYADGRERQLLLSCSPQFARVHLTSVRPASKGEQPLLAASLRRLADGAKVVSIRQRGFDRILDIELGKPEGSYRLVAELTGKHANLILIGPDRKVIAGAHHVPPRQSVRPIQPGRIYEPPPFPPRKPLYEATDHEELKDAEGASPFLLRLLEARAGAPAVEIWDRFHAELESLGKTVRERAFQSFQVKGMGAYPISVRALGYDDQPADLSDALDQEFGQAQEEAEREALRQRLVNGMGRVLLAREVALQELEQAEAAGRGAGRLQLMGELLLAYGATIPEAADRFATQDYEGQPMEIPLDPEASPLENAQRYFERAKRAKSRAAHIGDPRKRLSDDRIGLLGLIRRAEDAGDVETLKDIEARARELRWLNEPLAPPAKTPEDRPYEGHRIRERTGPGGVRVLYGENATSNDYLTHRVARPNDIWLHVRGSTSAHVVVLTQNKPDRIGPEALRFAASLAVANSTSKHSKYVPVDYTLKKYVRKLRGAKAGTVTYSHEKTLHVEQGAMS